MNVRKIRGSRSDILTDQTKIAKSKILIINIIVFGKVMSRKVFNHLRLINVAIKIKPFNGSINFLV